jgi:dTDP-4-amino-4,6-dideoxygalactose transaminase
LGKLKKGDAVIVPANTYIASIIAIIEAGLVPVLVEPDIDTYNISPQLLKDSITAETKAILAVHLYGRLADMDIICEIAKEHNLLLVEDAAQAHGAMQSEMFSIADFQNDENGSAMAGNLADAAAFSFYPAKNLGALGDAGCITTNDEALANMIRSLRNYGSSQRYHNEFLGVNSRLDEMQAAYLRIRLPQLDPDNARRREIANNYLANIGNPKIILPKYDGSSEHVFHLFVVRTDDREAFQQYLLSKEIESVIHYPIAPHKQEALSMFSSLSLPITEKIHNEVISLPISPVLTADEVEQVIFHINNY